jgi:hypothetical protein
MCWMWRFWWSPALHWLSKCISSGYSSSLLSLILMKLLVFYLEGPLIHGIGGFPFVIEDLIEYDWFKLNISVVPWQIAWVQRIPLLVTFSVPIVRSSDLVERRTGAGLRPRGVQRELLRPYSPRIVSLAGVLVCYKLFLKRCLLVVAFFASKTTY